MSVAKGTKTYIKPKRIAYLFMAAVLVASLASWQTPFFAGAENVPLAEEVAESTLVQDAFSQEADAPADASVEEHPQTDAAADEGEAPDTGLSSSDDTVDTSGESAGRTTSEPALSPQGLDTSIAPQAEYGDESGEPLWAFDAETGDLSIGAGTLGSYGSPDEWPWKDYRSLVTTITFTGEVKTNTLAVGMFASMTNLTTINHLNRLDTAATTNFSSMFKSCSSLSALDLSNFTTDKAVSMDSMFYKCSSLTSLDLGKFNTSLVTNMKSMFQYCSGLTSLDFLAALDTTKVTNMSSMFAGCSGFTSVDFPASFTTAAVTDMGSFFNGWKGLEELNFPETFATTKVTNMSGMFDGCTNLTSISFPSSFSTAKVVNMSTMFSGCSNITSLDLSGFNTSNLKNMAWMFQACRSLQYVNLESFVTTKVTNMESLFSTCISLKSIDISNFETPALTGIKSMFFECSSLETLVFPESFNTSSVTDMKTMFVGCSSLTSLDISSFNTIKVGDMKEMFKGSSNLIHIELGASFAFVGTDHLFPTPSGLNAAGKLYSGKWKALSDGALYQTSSLPANQADTYDAEILDPSLSITGELVERQTLDAFLSGGGDFAWTYQWSRGDSAAGPFTNISGATASSYTTTEDDADRYMKCTASYGGVSVSAVVGPIQRLLPDAPRLNSAALASNGTVELGYTTASSDIKPYTHIIAEYRIDGSGSWISYGEIAAVSSEVEDASAELDISSVFEAADIPTTVDFRIKAKNTRGESAWSNVVALDTHPQISVTVPVEMIGLVSGAGDITAPAQAIENTGNLNIKVVNIAVSTDDESYPTSSWVCYPEDDEETPLWQGDSSSSGPVASSPLLAPHVRLNFVWRGTMTNTDGIVLSASPVPYGSITYTVGFAHA